jgi:hypothetical protein
MSRTAGLGLAVAIVLGGPALGEEARKPAGCGFLNLGDCEMQELKDKGVQDLRWNHSCPIYYPIRREGNACFAGGVEVGASFPGGCCTKLTAEEDRSESCRTGLNKWVGDAKAASARKPGRNRAALWYSINRDKCARELGEIAAQTGRALPVRGAAATPRANAAIAESLGRRPGSERRPGLVDSGGGDGGGGDDTAAYVLDILEFALGAASIVAANYRPRVGGSYGTRDPGRAPPANSYVRPVPRTHQSDITGTR